MKNRNFHVGKFSAKTYVSATVSRRRTKRREKDFEWLGHIKSSVIRCFFRANYPLFRPFSDFFPSSVFRFYFISALLSARFSRFQSAENRRRTFPALFRRTYLSACIKCLHSFACDWYGGFYMRNSFECGENVRFSRKIFGSNFVFR